MGCDGFLDVSVQVSSDYILGLGVVLFFGLGFFGLGSCSMVFRVLALGVRLFRIWKFRVWALGYRFLRFRV